ncbi:MAG TPA: hypothetical protein VG367_16745 [Mucilaginibacter sp.]|nr:hypothetical protein [Mucilaginibacter sp.]
MWKSLYLAFLMASRSNFTSFYLLAILICIGVGIVTEDKYIGILLAIAAVLWLAGIQARRNRKNEY